MKRALAAASLVLLLSLTGCNPFRESWEWNQKLTVEVLVDGKVVSGSAVSFVRWSEANMWGNYGTHYRGEATMVDLGERGMLFALMGEGTKHIARHTLRDELGERLYERLFPKIEQFRGSHSVPRDSYPLMVTFGDINDPATVKRVDPKNLAASFGSGVSLRHVTLTITDETVSKGAVSGVLGWLDRYMEADLWLNGKACVACPVESDDLADLINTGQFVAK